MNVLYPMSVAAHSKFSVADAPVDSRIRFLLSFDLNQRLGLPNYGTRLREIEQLGGHLDDLLKMVTLEVRDSLGNYVNDASTVSVIATNDTLKNRSVQVYLTWVDATGATQVSSPVQVTSGVDSAPVA